MARRALTMRAAVARRSIDDPRLWSAVTAVGPSHRLETESRCRCRRAFDEPTASLLFICPPGVTGVLGVSASRGVVAPGVVAPAALRYQRVISGVDAL